MELQPSDSSLSIEEVTPLPDGWKGLAVIGFPIDHSISPALHNSALAFLAQSNPSFAKWVYHKIEVIPANLEKALKKLTSCGYIGLNLTIPHKVEILKLIDRINENALAMGAVNTLTFQSGEWVGSNSDGPGLRDALLEDFGESFQSRETLLLGAGGAARSAAVQCLDDNCPHLWILNRSPERLREVEKILLKRFGNGRFTCFTFDTIPNSFRERENLLVLNGTSLGLRTSDPLPFDIRELKGKPLIYDMIYNPSETLFLKVANDLGYARSNGLSMLLHQAAISLGTWTKKEIPVSTMRFAAAQAMSALEK